ncbi:MULTISPECIES: metallophosphoesterase family protein [Sphingobacterium]|uniref:metallophosphoesterase family protein n=1 Tax=Sphingobacterium TaxID=28453 RepID=UPI0013DA5642|nr:MULTISPECIES: metallophosphoesterase [unclassified Sphingobacterium]
MRKIALIVAFGLFSISIKTNAQDFSFAFFTDMHIYNDSTLNIVENKITKTKSKVDFILLGGDNVDIDNKNEESLPLAIERYKKLKNIFKIQGVTFYPTIGNHDRLPHKLSNNLDSLFLDLFGKTYYSYDHKGVKFIVLNSVQNVKGKYTIGEEQLEWLKLILSKTNTSQPIVISTHVPFLSVYYPVLEGKYTDADTFSNQKEVFDLFRNHNLKLVLQGHMHLYEEIKVKNVMFITAGALSGNWWSGDYHGTFPGNLLVHYKNGEFTWQYKK